MTPYSDLPDRNFWRKAASHRDFDAANLYQKKFEIGTSTRIATAGSCFAQHIGRYLKASNGALLDVEPAPEGFLPTSAQKFGFNLYSARYGNIYSAAQLRQLVKDAIGGAVHKDAIWEKDGRYYDALRPTVEPDGLSSPDEVIVHRKMHLMRVKELFQKTDVLVFTLGLTEAWTHRRSGRVYPTCPGVVAGTFEPQVHAFKNFTYPEVMKDLVEARRLLRKLNRNIRILLTVSPVPLVATAMDQHVLSATTYSKSVLRAVAGDMTAQFADVGYFPSYEMITGGPARGQWMAEDLRTVRPEGVAQVMQVFFRRPYGLAATSGHDGDQNDAAYSHR